jgi:NAD(P)-dependent dehydrogenase (short-subunit alcohol dehydrogenase family)
VAAVSGGAGGIGGAICAALREVGNEIAVIDRVGEFSCDLGDAAAVERAAVAVLERFGRCDLFVHAAAAFDHFGLADFDLEAWRHVQAVNVESALLLARAFSGGMRERGFGRIVFITSNTHWVGPAPSFLAYNASKAALEGIARALARALGADGITVNAVAPGLTRTPRTESELPPQAFAAARAAQALPRNVESRDVAATVAFLCSEAAASISGQALCVDGGQVLR